MILTVVFICSGGQEPELAMFLFTYPSTEIPLEYWIILYIVGKVFMRRLQRRWNRRKRFRSDGEIPETSLANVDLRGELILEVCLHLLVVLIATYGYLRCCHRLREKGDGSFIWNSMQRIQESQVNIRLPLISLISFFYTLDSGQIWDPQKAVSRRI